MARPTVEFAINSAWNRSTGYSPFFLNYGREPATHASFLTGAPVSAAAGPLRENAVGHQVVQTTAEALARAKESIAAAKEQQAEYANRSRQEVTYQRGDEVLLSAENQRRWDAGTRKLDMRWLGPYKVTEQVGAVSYYYYYYYYSLYINQQAEF